jgi:triphosphoribosyl-dephospho-CoA synthase
MGVTASAAAIRPRRAVPRVSAARTIGRIAIRSLHAELVLYPKPGLVSPNDSGAHKDMDAATMMRGLVALRHYFVALAQAGERSAPLSELRRLGVAAETRMLEATGGINTHRGSIFSLGLLAAAAARARALRLPVNALNLRETLAYWRNDLAVVGMATQHPPSHGRWVAHNYGASGARGEARNGFPAVFERALPALQHAIASGADERAARLHAFFVLLSSVDDTNVLFRGGRTVLEKVQRSASDFLTMGSVFAAGWNRRAESLHRYCCAVGVSPGGCADLLAATVFAHEVSTRLR